MQMRGLQTTTTENESSATKIEEQEQNNTISYQVKLYLNQGRFMIIDPNFVFSKLCSLREIFFQYHVKDSVEDIPPLKLLDSMSVKQIKRGESLLSYLRYLMEVL